MVLVLIKYFQCFSDGECQFLTVPIALMGFYVCDILILLQACITLVVYIEVKEASGCPPPVTTSDMDISDFIFFSIMLPGELIEIALQPSADMVNLSDVVPSLVF